MKSTIMFLILCISTLSYAQRRSNRLEKKAIKRVAKFCDKFNNREYENLHYPYVGTLVIDSLFVDKSKNKVTIYFNNILAYVPVREESLRITYLEIKRVLKRKFHKYSISIFSEGKELSSLVPNFYRSSLVADSTRKLNLPTTKKTVTNISRPYKISRGLDNNTIALWHSHGWYFEPKLNRWEWQRARLFQTVEDLYPMDYILNYITPMLENAGANVFMPRERDTQINEVIVDNDNSSKQHITIDSKSARWYKGKNKGFALPSKILKANENPFNQGSYLQVKAEKHGTAKINYLPNIPESGTYAVTIAYKSLDNSVEDALYKVFHKGGVTEFHINQNIGGGTWIYLGHFEFNKGVNNSTGMVQICSKSNQSGLVTADAVRFGGGRGSVARGIKFKDLASKKKIKDTNILKNYSRFVNPKSEISGRPRYLEAARYYLQYAGMPQDIVYNMNGKNSDYKDDYQSRGEWVNYLKGAPFGPTRKRGAKGLGIPIDLCFGFHTDAGVTSNDSVIGTLAIYSYENYLKEKLFPDGKSRMANRDFADIMQTQIVNDIRATTNPRWTRRSMWDKHYSEAWRPNVPSVLLELLSHQNFADMKFGHDPNFKFLVGRSIYKSMLKFLSSTYCFDYVVQPLPINNFCSNFVANQKVRLNWTPVVDSLESTAVATRYVLYTKIDNGGFDNGVVVDSTSTVIKIKKDLIYSFKVCALNDGGKSFPSEILSVCRRSKSKGVVLIVNGFDRVDAPSTIESSTMRGFANFIDEGVPYGKTHSTTGDQYNFSHHSLWKDDDQPGCGASYADNETSGIVGNTFDYSYTHGLSIANAGFSFVSSSDEAIENNLTDMNIYSIVDFAFGEEKTTICGNKKLKKFTIFTPSMQKSIATYCKKGKALFISGAYIGSDIKFSEDKNAELFVANVLKYKPRTDHASKTGKVYCLDRFHKSKDFEFITKRNSDFYNVESPDGIVPADNNAFTFLRYSDNNVSAGVVFLGDYKVVAIGFPFETIKSQSHRDNIMGDILRYFND